MPGPGDYNFTGPSPGARYTMGQASDPVWMQMGFNSPEEFNTYMSAKGASIGMPPELRRPVPPQAGQHMQMSVPGQASTSYVQDMQAREDALDKQRKGLDNPIFLQQLGKRQRQQGFQDALMHAAYMSAHKPADPTY